MINKTKMIDGKQFVRRENIFGNIEEVENKKYLAQIMMILDVSVDSKEVVKKSYTWRYTDMKLPRFIYGKPVETQDAARNAYLSWIAMQTKKPGEIGLSYIIEKGKQQYGN